MRTFSSLLLLVLVVGPDQVRAGPAENTQVPPEENYCAICHGEKELWEKETLKFFVPKEDFEHDIHWQKGIQCHHCHGGDPATSDFNEAHAVENGFRVVKAPTDISKLCAICHSDAEYMKRYLASPETDQEAKYWESAHGQHLHRTEDPKGATCVSCHGRHGMRPVDDPQSPVSPSRLTETCSTCHHDQLVGLRMGVHAKAGEKDERGAGTPMGCGKCHGEDAHEILRADDTRSPMFLDHQVGVCGSCHEKHLEEYDNSVHGHGLHRSGLLVTASCSDCHGAHDICYAADKRSKLHVGNVAKTCGKCHRFIEERLQKSLHARDHTATTTLASFLKSTLDDEQFVQEAKALAKCLRGIPGTDEFVAEAEAAANRLEEASGGASFLDQVMRDRLEKLLENLLRRPSCTSCHQGHDLLHPETIAFRLQLPHRCGNCHPELSGRYAMSLHGQLTELDYGPAAKCSDCHGAHDILPINNPRSRLGTLNRLETCKKCHPHAVENFCNFDPHANHEDAGQYPGLHGVYMGMQILLYSVFGFFGLHLALWFVRSLVHTLKHGRPKRLGARQRAYIRFEPIHRVLHVIVIVSFLVLALTGLPLKYSDQTWAGNLARALGGFDSTRVFHRVCAVATFFYFAAHLAWLAKKVFQQRMEGVEWKAILFGPDSPVPNFRDIKDFFRMLRWFFGLGPKPVFERWAYWEKFDYWAVFWGVGIIGTSGLMLWFPNLFSRILPGDALNIAKVIHSEEALLATGFIFAIHFFHTHFRPEKFPMDLSILTGLVDEEELREERPAYLDRIREKRLRQMKAVGVQEDRPEYLEWMREEGKLDQVCSTAPSRTGFSLIMLGGLVALGVGLSLLAGMVLAALAG